MSDHDADVAAVLAETDHIGLPVEDCQAHHVCLAEARRSLAALTAANYAVVKLSEGVTVEHGARLVATPLEAAPLDGGGVLSLYAIEPPRRP